MKKAFWGTVVAMATSGAASAHAVSHVGSSKALVIVPEPSSLVQLSAGLLVVFAATLVARRLFSRAEAK